MGVNQPVNGIGDRSANEYIVSAAVQDDGYTLCPPSSLPLAQGSEADAKLF